MPAGRHITLTPEIAATIVETVRIGAPLKVAAQRVAISEGTLYDWLAAGEGRPSKVAPTDELREFSERVRKAKGEAHARAVGTITSAIVGGSWQAAQAWIKMRYPDQYAERTEISGPGGGPIAIEVAQALEGLTEDELASIEAHIAAGTGVGEADRSGAGEA